MGPHEPSKQFQNLLDIYSVVSRELTTLWFRNLDINYKRSQNIGWNEHKSWPWSSSRINHKTFNGLSTQHEKQYLEILHGSREKWYESYSLLIRKQPTSRDANGTGFPVKWRVWWTSAEVNSILMTCHHPDLGDKQKFKSSAEDWHWLQIVFCLIFLWWGLLGAVTSRNKLWLRAALKLLQPNNQASGASHWVWRRVIRRAEKQRNTVKAGRNICW